MRKNKRIIILIKFCLNLLIISTLVSCTKKFKYNGELIAFQNQNKSFYFADSNLKKINNLKFDLATNFNGEYAIVENKGKSYVINRNFEEVYVTKERQIELYNNFIIIRKYNFNDEVYNLKSQKHFKLNSNISNIWKNKFFILHCKGGKYSLYSLEINKIIYNNLDSVKSNYLYFGVKDLDYLYAKVNNKEFLIDSCGSAVLNPEYDLIFPEIDLIRPFLKNGKLGLFDNKFNIILLPEFDKIGNIEIKYNLDRTINFNYLNKLFQNLNLVNYKNFKSQNFTAIKKNGQHFIYHKFNHNLKKIQWIITSDFCENYAIIKVMNKYSFIDTNGIKICNGNFDEVLPFKNCFSFGKNKNKWMIIDKHGQMKSNIFFDGIKENIDDFGVKNGKFIARNSNLWGVIDTNGVVILPFKFDEIKLSNRINIYFAKKDGYNFLYNDNGIKLLNIQLNENSIFENEHFLILKQNHECIVFGKNLEILLKIPADDYELISKTILKILYKDKINYYKL